MRERPAASVPAWIWATLGIGLGLQIMLGAIRPGPRAAAGDLRPPPSADVLRLASIGEPTALGKALMLYLQAFDYQAGTRTPYRDLDYPMLVEWLDRILALDPGGQYPLMSAARLYAEVPDPAKQRLILDLIYRQYLLDPNRRWPWLAHATVVAKHQLKDLPLARKYAVALQQNTTAKDVPVWVTQMEPFILEDMNELETAKVMLGGLIASGKITGERDLRLLQSRLAEIEERIKREAPQQR